MSMTATDFRALAGVIAGARALADGYEDDPQHDGYADGILDATEVIASSIAAHCKERNHRFDRERFMAQCGIDVEVLAMPGHPNNHHNTDEVTA